MGDYILDAKEMAKENLAFTEAIYGKPNYEGSIGGVR